MNVQGRLIGIAFFLALLVLLDPLPASAQYIYLDANGDGLNDDTDVLDPNGSTRVDIWLDTSRNKDGSPAICDTDVGTPLTINSWEVVLRAVGGTVEWGPLDNMLPISPVRSCFASDADTTDPVWYHNGWGGMSLLEPALYHVGRLRIRVLTGAPTIVFRPNNPAQPTDLTAFGTKCPCLQGDNTYRLGEDWFDAAGIGEGLVADAGGPYLVRINEPLVFDSSETLNVRGGTLTYLWDFGDGGEGSGASPTHSYAEPGDYQVTLRVSDGSATHETWTTVSVLPSLPPIADIGGPYSGNVGIPILFDGRGSSDPNGDPIWFAWRFGDGTGSGDSNPFHTYFQPGTYTVTLVVYDGYSSSSAAALARIDPGTPHPPVADAGGPYHGYAGVRLQFDGSGSTDPDGDPLQYRWFFGDGNDEGSVRSPHNTYAEAGTYEVILEVSDGIFTTSDATTAVIEVSQGAPPTASAGGPYHGVTRAPIVFEGGGSTDPDGDALTYRWDFGDQTSGEGASPSHVYVEAAQYGVVLTVSDGTFVTEARTTAIVSHGVPPKARAFLMGGARDLALSALGSTVVVRLEPIDATFRRDEIDAGRIVLRNDVAYRQGSIAAQGADLNAVDSDGNGVEEISVVFRAEDVKDLLSNVARPSSVRLTLEAGLQTGGHADAEWTPRVIPADSRFAAVVRPNPFNPQAVVTFVTNRPGTVSAHLYDTAGRLVRTVLRDQQMDAGPHDLPIVARTDAGAGLSSGVYFLRLEGPDGVVVTRVTVAK